MLMCAECGKPLLSTLGWKLLDKYAASNFCSCTHVREIYRVHTSAPKPPRTPVPQAFHEAFENDDLDPGGTHANF